MIFKGFKCWQNLLPTRASWRVPWPCLWPETQPVLQCATVCDRCKAIWELCCGRIMGLLALGQRVVQGAPSLSIVREVVPRSSKLRSVGMCRCDSILWCLSRVLCPCSRHDHPCFRGPGDLDRRTSQCGLAVEFWCEGCSCASPKPTPWVQCLCGWFRLMWPGQPLRFGMSMHVHAHVKYSI